MQARRILVGEVTHMPPRRHASPAMAESAAPPALTCYVCAAEATAKCSGCRARFYCGAECQEVHWKKSHRRNCAWAAAKMRERYNKPKNLARLWQAAADGDKALMLQLTNGATPLFVAAAQGHETIVRALLDAGADKTAKCDGKTARGVAKTAAIASLLR